MTLRSNEELLIGEDIQAAARLAADRFVAALRAHGEPRCVALAGGSTPKLLYETLAQPPYRQQIEALPVHWFWGDERAVPPDHTDSNYRLAFSALLAPLVAPAARIHRMVAERPDIGRAALGYEQTIREHVTSEHEGIPRFDLVLLGVGTDGHTASLFPGTPALSETSRLVVANFVPRLDAWRMTMTYPLLLAAHQVLFLVTGAGKAEIMAQLLSDAGSELPAAQLRASAGRVSWILDAEAARLVRSAGAA